MKNLSLILAILSLGTAPLLGVERALDENRGSPVVISISNEELGITAVQKIRSGYEKGLYSSFLEELDKSYQKAKNNGDLTELVGMREGPLGNWAEWESKMQDLQQKRNEALLSAIEGEKDSLFLDKVRSVSQKVTSVKEDEALAKLALFRQMTLDSGANVDENALIQLDLEYEYKALNMDQLGHFSPDLREKHIVLRMEKMDKMKALANSFSDLSLKEAVLLSEENLDARLAQSWDSFDLSLLARGHTKAMNRVEEKVAFILNQSQEEVSHLANQLLNE